MGGLGPNSQNKMRRRSLSLFPGLGWHLGPQCEVSTSGCFSLCPSHPVCPLPTGVRRQRLAARRAPGAGVTTRGPPWLSKHGRRNLTGSPAENFQPGPGGEERDLPKSPDCPMCLHEGRCGGFTDIKNRRAVAPCLWCATERFGLVSPSTS